MSSAALLLVDALRDPPSVHSLDNADWTELLTVARAESLLGTLAARLEGEAVAPGVEAVLADARQMFEVGRVQALWEADCARRALEGHVERWVLMKGTAYLAAGLDAGQGRSIGDLDIMVARSDLAATEAALLAAGWEWVKPDTYDDSYYRRWMHELPPLIHHNRDRMIDVHHTILPLTARPRPAAAAMLERSIEVERGYRVFAPADMVCHCAAHLMADGDLAGGLRNLWDLDRLVRQFARDPGFWDELAAVSDQHGLRKPVARALRLANRLYATPVDPMLVGRSRASDRLFEARLLARGGWGQETRKLLRFAFTIRSHWLRMPPLLLARHLWTKWRKR